MKITHFTYTAPAVREIALRAERGFGASLTIEKPQESDTPVKPVPPADEIWYTSSDGNIVEPYKTGAFGATIFSNTYENGKGIIKFNGNITSIGEWAFCDCDALESITIPNSVTEIGKWAFHRCSALTSINIPDSVTSIGKEAFAGCSALTSITIPNSVTSIGNYAFDDCSALESFYGKLASEDNRCVIIDGVPKAFAPAGLTSYTIPNSVTSIGNYAFYYCEALTSITIPNSVIEIGKGAFARCYALTSITIPNSVTEIGEDAFRDCEALKSVTIGNGVTSIGNYAFYYCKALTNITIPDGVTSIGAGAFYECDALESINIPNSFTSIGDCAFAWCKALKEVYCKPTTPPTGGGSMFDNNPFDRKIYVPTASVNAYKAAYRWSDYKSAIEPYDFTE